MLKDQDLSPHTQARLDKCLDRQYNFDGEVMTLRDYLTSAPLTHKTTYTRTRSTRKTNGQYPKLKRPVTTHTAWVGESGVEVPKLVYDALDLPQQ